MAIPHLAPGERLTLMPSDLDLTTARTAALFKTEHLEVIRLVLRAGKSFPPHQVPGEITIQCLAGRLEVTANGSACTLEPGQLLYLGGGVVHSVLALEDACGVVTIILKP